MPLCLMNFGNTSASHFRPSGSNGRSRPPTQNRRSIAPPLPPRNSTELSVPKRWPSLMRRYAPGLIRLTSESSSVNSMSPR